MRLINRTVNYLYRKYAAPFHNVFFPKIGAEVQATLMYQL